MHGVSMDRSGGSLHSVPLQAKNPLKLLYCYCNILVGEGCDCGLPSVF